MPSIIFGFFYAIGVVTILYGVAGIDGFEVPLYLAFFFLLIVLVFLFVKSKTYDKEYIYSQFIRIASIVIANLIISSLGYHQ